MKHLSLVLLLAVALTSIALADPPATQPARQIPLHSIYTTSWQKGLQRAADGPMPLYDGQGPAVCAVTWSKDFKSINPNELILVPAAGDKPLSIKPPANPDAQLWAIVFLGASGSQPPQWLVDSVSVPKDNEFEIAFHPAPPGPMTKDLFSYVAWVPLGKLTAGKYLVRFTESGKARGEATWMVTDAAPATQPARTKTNEKGWELRVWQDKDQTFYSLLPGTNRLKTEAEITKSAVKSLDEIEKQLGEIKEGQQVILTGHPVTDRPSEATADALIDYCNKIGLQVQMQK